MQKSVYTLPELQFVGGSSKEIKLRLKMESGAFYHGDSSTLFFSIVNYSNKTDIPLVHKTVSLTENEDGIYCIATILLEPEDTKYLAGKFVYQVTIVDEDGNSDIPNQGIIYIAKNISPDAI